eukprot:851493_1
MGLNTSTGDVPETQTKHDEEVVLYDEYDVVMCVWGFILIHMESTQPFQSNNVIPEAIKQLIVNFVGEYFLFLKMTNDSEHQQIELKIHSHKGHFAQFTPEKMLQSNDDFYWATCLTNDWIIFSIDNDHLYYPTKVQVRGRAYGDVLKNFRVNIGNINS